MLAWLRSGAKKPTEFQPSAGCQDPLREFLEWYAINAPAFPAVPEVDGVNTLAGLPGVVLYRSGQFQIQLFIFPPGTHARPHRHPNIDTIEMFVAGDFDFRVNGQSSIPMDHLQDRRGSVSRWWGRGVRVTPNDRHELMVYDTPAVFLSVQHWLNGVPPSTVGADWEGEPTNDLHRSGLASR